MTCRTVETESVNNNIASKISYKDEDSVKISFDSRTNTVDLSKKDLIQVPISLLQLAAIKHLYLEGNKLSSLPGDFFSCLPVLKWLDLRRNVLVSLSCPSLVDHKNLETLLLEGNQLKTLPLELGMVSSLKSLNVRDNPIEFPPTEILQKGVKRICQYLKDLWTAKLEGKNQEDIDKILLNQKSQACTEENGGVVEDVKNSNSSNNKSDQVQQRKVVKSEYKKKLSMQQRSQSLENKRTPVVCITQSEKYLNPDGEIPLSDEVIEARALADYKLDKKRTENMKIDSALQKIKNKEVIKNFQDEAKRLQQKKLMEKRIRGRLDYEQPATKAPFGFDKDQLKIATNEERLAYDPRSENTKPRPMSPTSVLLCEQQRMLREKLVEAKIYKHTETMRERRLKPCGDPQQELRAAKQELETALLLKAELDRVRAENNLV